MMKDLSMLKKPKYTGILEDDGKEEKKAEKKQKKTTVKKQMGRPALKDNEKKTEYIRVYLTKAEKEKFLEKVNAFAPAGIQITETQFLRKLLTDNDLI